MGITPSLLLIVPTLNSYKVLPRLIKSLKSQIFEDWKLLFVDGPSNNDHKLYLYNCCKNDKRINYINQDIHYKGIYGAMNQGLIHAKSSDWILFWGSDDWAVSNKTFFNIMSLLNKYKKNDYLNMPDIVISRGIYVNALNGAKNRLSKFDESKTFHNKREFCLSMLRGNSPPHQATLFGPSSRLRDPLYNDRLTLTADLDFFIFLGIKKNLKVEIFKETIVNMEDAGISSRFFWLRIFEVIKTYFTHYKIFFIIPFIARYIKRLMSKNNLR